LEICRKSQSTTTATNWRFLGDSFRGISSVCSGLHLKLEDVIFLTSFRRSKNARPEHDIQNINVIIRIETLQEQGDPPPDGLEAIKALRAEICPNLSILDIGRRVADSTLASYKSAKAVQVQFAVKVDGRFRGTNFHVLKRNTSEEGTNRSHNGWEQYEYTCLRVAKVTTAIGSRTQEIMIYLRSTEKRELIDPYSVVLRKENQSQKVCKESELNSLSSGSLPPMFEVLARVAKHIENESFTDSQALELRLANLAFQTADESMACRLSEISVWTRSQRTERLIGTVDHTRNDSTSQRVNTFVSLQRSVYEKTRHSTKNDHLAAEMRRAYVALGSNVGDRLGMVESACLEMKRRGINVARTSALYETEPMYLQDQHPFINGACEVGIVLAWSDFLPSVVP